MMETSLQNGRGPMSSPPSRGEQERVHYSWISGVGASIRFLYLFVFERQLWAWAWLSHHPVP